MIPVTTHSPHIFLDPPAPSYITANLQNFDALNGLSISRDANGDIDPAQDLFRTDWPGVSSGPLVSQFLMADFDIDGIVVEPKQKTLVPEVEYMTGVDTWLDVQVSLQSVRDPSPRLSVWPSK